MCLHSRYLCDCLGPSLVLYEILVLRHFKYVHPQYTTHWHNMGWRTMGCDPCVNEAYWSGGSHCKEVCHQQKWGRVVDGRDADRGGEESEGEKEGGKGLELGRLKAESGTKQGVDSESGDVLGTRVREREFEWCYGRLEGKAVANFTLTGIMFVRSE